MWGWHGAGTGLSWGATTGLPWGHYWVAIGLLIGYYGAIGVAMGLLWASRAREWSEYGSRNWACNRHANSEEIIPKVSCKDLPGITLLGKSKEVYPSDQGK